MLQRYGFAGLPARIITAAVFYDNPNAVPPLQLAELAVPGMAKVGQSGQWLRVITVDGTQGYVAAWYVHTAHAPAMRAAA